MRVIIPITTIILLSIIMIACNHTNKNTTLQTEDTLTENSNNLIAEKQKPSVETSTDNELTPVFKIEKDKRLQVVIPVNPFYPCINTDSLQLVKTYKVPYFTEADYKIEVYKDAGFEDSSETPRIVMKRGEQEIVDMLNGSDFVNWEKVKGFTSKEYVQYIPLSENVVLALFTTLRDGTCEPSPGNVTIVAFTSQDAKLVFCQALEFDQFNLTPGHFRMTLNIGCSNDPHYILWQDGEKLMFQKENTESHP